jgi:hypothetical protein
MIRSSHHLAAAALVAVAGATGSALAQLPPTHYVATPLGVVPPILPPDGNGDLNWNTIDNSGRMMNDGVSLTLGGTVGQCDPGRLTGADLELYGGCWPVFAEPEACYANCDGSTTPPVVNTGDFTCFLQQYSAAVQMPAEQQQIAYANCDGSTIFPMVNTGDFTCFLQKYAAGCS